MIPRLDIEAISRRLKAIVKYRETRDFYDLNEAVEFNHQLHQNNRMPSKKSYIPRHLRMIMYPKDIEVIYGEHDEYCRLLIDKIRKYKHLPKGAPVLITDFCEYTGFSYTIALNITNDCQISEASWTKYYDSRDWYDLPESIDVNQLLYQNIEGKRHRWNKDWNARWIIYPKDIEVIYNFTPEDAYEYIKHIRESLNLSVSCPLMNYDVMDFTSSGIAIVDDFIMKS